MLLCYCSSNWQKCLWVSVALQHVFKDWAKPSTSTLCRQIREKSLRENQKSFVIIIQRFQPFCLVAKAFSCGMSTGKSTLITCQGTHRLIKATAIQKLSKLWLIKSGSSITPREHFIAICCVIMPNISLNFLDT